MPKNSSRWLAAFFFQREGLKMKKREKLRRRIQRIDWLTSGKLSPVEVFQRLNCTASMTHLAHAWSGNELMHQSSAQRVSRQGVFRKLAEMLLPCGTSVESRKEMEYSFWSTCEESVLWQKYGYNGPYAEVA